MLGVAGPRQPGPKYGQPVVPNLNVKQICPNCRSDPPNIIEEYSKGDLVCGDCGTILGDRIVDTRSEWRTFAGDEGGDDPSRVGDAGNPLLGVNHLDTMISGRDGHTGLSAQLQRAAARSAAQGGGGPGRGQNTTSLAAVFSKISEKCDQMQLPGTIAQRAQHVYKIADEKKVIRHKNETAIIAACIIFACRDAGANRSFAELGKALKVKKKELYQVFMTVKGAVQEDRSFGQNHTAGAASYAAQVDSILARLVNYMHLPQIVYNMAKYIAVIANEKTNLDGRSYTSVATGVLYFTCILTGQQEATSKEIGQLAQVSETTVKLICKLVARDIDQLIKPEWPTQYKEGYLQLKALGRVNERSAAAAAANAQDRSSSATPRGATPVPSAAATATATPTASTAADTNGTATPIAAEPSVESSEKV